MNALATLNMDGWTVRDFELAYEGLRQVCEATGGLLNQPRSSNDHSYHPGAAFIFDLGENWCSNVMYEIIERLKLIRLPDPKDDERRILLILQDLTRWGSAAEPLSQILAYAMVQQGRAA